jgi:hypothetical protein
MLRLVRDVPDDRDVAPAGRMEIVANEGMDPHGRAGFPAGAPLCPDGDPPSLATFRIDDA